MVVTAIAQEPRIAVRISGRFDLFTTDELGNIYALHDDEVELYNARGELGIRNSTKTFGRIVSVDAFYSLKPLLFSRDQGQIAMLDNTLSLQGSVINLPRRGFPQVVLVSASVQNAFWLYDERELQLIRVDALLREIAATGRIDQLLGITPQPLQMHELDNWLYVNSPEHGILVFDLFGTYYKTLPVLGADRFHVRGNGVYFVKDGSFFRYDLRDLIIESMPLPREIAERKLRDAHMEQGHLYLLYDDEIVIVTPSK
ncbi:MAG: hypothetical protein KDB88_11620 [Flavobacteriales bacterium]|nr:hypothetical protein [Flavobacteriales bacterium]